MSADLADLASELSAIKALAVVQRLAPPGLWVLCDFLRARPARGQLSL
jgi:hypothetical protein